MRARTDDSDVYNGKPQQLFHHGLHTFSFSASYLHFSRCIHQEASADIVIKRLIIPSSSCVTVSPYTLMVTGNLQELRILKKRKRKQQN
jgi:hypothetical protein